MRLKKLSKIIVLFLLVVVISTLILGVCAQASTVNACMQINPVFGVWFLDKLNPISWLQDSIRDMLRSMIAFLLGKPIEELQEALFEKTNVTELIEKTSDDPLKPNRAQKWFDIFEIAALLCIPLIAVKVAIMLMGTFVNPEKRGELKSFITDLILFVIVLVFAKQAILWLVELNDAIVALFHDAYSQTVFLEAVNTENILGLILVILICLGVWVMVLYIKILLFIRKMLITFAYMLIPIAAVMLFSKKFRGVLGRLYEETLALIFQQAMYAGTFVILYDLIVYVASFNASFNTTNAADDGIQSFWNLMFVRQVDVVYDGGSGKMWALGPIGWLILLFLLIKIVKKLQQLFTLQPSYAPDAGDMIKGGVKGVLNVAEGVRSFGKSVGSIPGVGWAAGKVRDKLSNYSSMRKLGGIARNIGSKASPFTGFITGGARWASGLATLAAGTGLGITGVSTFGETIDQLSDAKMKFLEGVRALKPVLPPPKEDIKKLKAYQLEQLKSGATIRISEDQRKAIMGDEFGEFLTDGDKYFAKKTGKDRYGNDIYKFYKKDGDRIEEISENEAKMLNLPDEVKQWARFGGNRYTYLDNGDGTYTVKASDFKEKASIHYNKKFDTSNVLAHMDFEEFVPQDTQNKLLNYTRRNKGRVTAVVNDDMVYFMGVDVRTGQHELIDMVRLDQNRVELLRSELNIDGSGPQICGLNVNENGMQFIGGFEHCNEIDYICVNEAIRNGSRKVIRKHIQYSQEKAVELRAEVENKNLELSSIQSDANRIQENLRNVTKQIEERIGSVDELNVEIEKRTAVLGSSLTLTPQIRMQYEKELQELVQLRNEKAQLEEQAANLESKKAKIQSEIERIEKESRNQEEICNKLQSIIQLDVTPLLNNRFNNTVTVTDISNNSTTRDVSDQLMQARIELAKKMAELTHAFSDPSSRQNIDELVKEIEKIKQKYNDLSSNM